MHRSIPARSLSLGRFALIALLVLALSALVAACESDEESSDAAATAPAASSSAAASSSSSSSAAATDTGASSAAAPAASEPQPPAAPVLSVVTTSNIVADWARNVGGDRVNVTGLLPAGGDPHTYQPGARDVAQIADADLVLSIGLGLEGGWLEELIHNASADDAVFALGDHIGPIEFEETGSAHHGEEEEEGHEELVGRLLVADRESASVSVLDLEHGEVDLHAFSVAAPSASLYTSPSGRFVFATARGPEDEDDRLHIFDGGIFADDHDGHQDLVNVPVSLLSLETTDQRPIHVAAHAGWTAVFHDATGRIALFEEHDLEEEGDDYEPVWLETPPHHGAGIALGEGYFIASVNPDGALPRGVEVRDADDSVVYDGAAEACPLLHGEAAGSHGVGFGCGPGVLIIEGHDGDFEHVFVDNHPDMAEGARIGSLWGHGDAANLFGSASYRDAEGNRVNGGLWLVNGEAGEMVAVLPGTPEKQVLGAVFDEHGEEVFVITYDGALNVIDAESGEVLDVVDLVDPFTGADSPAYTSVGGFLYVSDRAGGRILEFSLEDGEIEREWAIAGTPGSIAFTGVGAAEDLVEHDHGPLDPHFWFDPMRVKGAVGEIAELFAELDPAGAAVYQANAQAYGQELDALHQWATGALAPIPVERRILVTSHDSMSYFAVVYGFEVVGVVIPGGTTEVDPSAREVRELIEIIEHEDVPAIFGETTVSDRLARTVADETGATFYSLYSGSLGPAGSGADTYLGMMRANVELIAEALG